MSHALRTLLAATLAAVLLAVPATAEEADACTDPESGELLLTESQVWLKPAETKAGNLGALGLTGFPTWSDEAPAQSVTDGAGGGYLGSPANTVAEANEELGGLTLTGGFDGCLDTMLVELYAFLPTNRTGTSASLEELPFSGRVSLDVDGEQIGFPSQLEVATVPNEGGDATYRLRFALTEIHRTLLDFGVEPGGEHQLRLNVDPQFVNTDHALFVYDTTEVPASITFNGAPDDTYTVHSVF